MQTLCFSWPNAEIAVMGPQGAVNIIFAKEIEGSKAPDVTRTELIDEYRDKFANPYIAAKHGIVDDVIDPRETRQKADSGARNAAHEKKEERPKRKHGNIPL
ncbi:hypothetical protein GCM10020331_041690 [Ectobacillus funiculus]